MVVFKEVPLVMPLACEVVKASLRLFVALARLSNDWIVRARPPRP
jgi:hypothetical protein